MMDSRPSDGDRDFGRRRTRYERLMDAMRAYGQVPQSMIPAGSGFKIESARGPRYLKRFRYGPQELWFIHYCLEHLRGRGFAPAPRVYMTLAGRPYVDVDGEVYYLQDWLELARPDFGDPGTLRACAELMAGLHRAGEGFSPPAELAGVRIQYGSWLDKCIKRLREIYGFGELAEDSTQGQKFDRRYARVAPVFYRQAEEAVRRLAELPLADLAEKERQAGTVCHRNFTPRNIALDDRSCLRILDFDNCACEIRLDDLARFIRRAAWLDLERAAFIVQSYGEARGRELSRDELALISAYLLFPREFWVVGRSRFHKHHRRERLLHRLAESAEDWGRFAEAVESLSTTVVQPTVQPTEAGTPMPAGLPEDVPIPEGPEQPLVPLVVTSAPEPWTEPLWRVDEAGPQPKLEEVSVVEEPTGHVPDVLWPPGDEPEPGVGTVPAHFPEGVKPYVLPAKAKAREAARRAVEPPAAAPATAEPVSEPVEPAAAEPAEQPASEERVASEPAEGDRPTEPTTAEVGVEAATLVAAAPEAEEMEGPQAVPAAAETVEGGPGVVEEAVPQDDDLPDEEYRTARGSLVTSGRTLVWGKWPKPIEPRGEGPEEHDSGA